jgi:cytochrome c553
MQNTNTSDCHQHAALQTCAIAITFRSKRTPTSGPRQTFKKEVGARAIRTNKGHIALRVGLILCLALAACNRGPALVTFEGALASDKAAQIRHGERLTWVLGCTGCHRPNLEGGRFFELYASNLTRELPKYSNRQFDRLLRRAQTPNGKVLWAMPSHIFQHLSEPDERALLAYLRTLKPAGIPTQPMLPFEPETKALLAKGVLRPEAQMVAETRDQMPVDLGSKYALGRYITSVTCAECHGPKLEGQTEPDKIPNLIVAGGYSRSEFERLITTGIPIGNRKLNEMMVEVAQERFPHLSPHERDALYAYLKARADQAR